MWGRRGRYGGKGRRLATGEVGCVVGINEDKEQDRV